MTNIVPLDTRYVPISQQPYCCVPASLTMVMIRNGIQPLPQELIGHHLGLTVPTNRKDEFWNVRHAEKPVVASGFGTQIQNEKEFGMQKALDKLGIPLEFEYIAADKLKSVKDFSTLITTTIEAGDDVLACVNWHSLIPQENKTSGHVLCVDKIYVGNIRLIDTGLGAKWKIFPVAQVFDAMALHGSGNYGGLWIFRKSIA